MWAKLATGLVTPLLALMLVVGLLRATDRTALPGRRFRPSPRRT